MKVFGRKKQRAQAAAAADAARRQAEIRQAIGLVPVVQPAPKPRVVRGLLFRGRRVLAPFAVLVGLFVAGLAVQAATPVAVLLVWAVLALVLWRARLASRLDRNVERRYALAVLAAVGVWLAWSAAGGAPAEVLAVGWAVASVPWWRHHWPRPRVDAPEVELVGDPTLELWNRHVADPLGPLAGAELTNPVPTEHGMAYDVQLVPGRQPLESVMAKLPAIAQGLRTPMERVLLEQHPDTDDPSIGRLQRITTSPIRDTQYFQGPRWDEQGRALLGPHADGVGDAVWRLYSRNSIWGGFVLGGTGSGKTRLLEIIAITVRAMSAAGYPTVLVYLDGQDGASSPLLWKHATLRGGPAEAPAILAGLERAKTVRQKWNRVHGLSGFTPGASPDGGRTPGLPGLLVIADECHAIYRDKHEALRWADVAREGRKVGIGEIGGDQYCDLAVFGNQEVLRQSLLAGNGLAMRTTTSGTKGLIPGLDLDPAQLPAIPGYGYKIAAPQSGERTAPFRAEYCPDAKDAAENPDLPVPTVEEWFERTADAELDDMTARAFGPVYLERAQREEASREAALAEIEGRTPPKQITAPRPEIVLAKTGGQAVQEVAVGEAEVATTRDAVLALLTEGPAKRAEIVRHIGASIGTGESAVKQALQRLLRERLVRRTDEHGVYELVGAAVAA